MPNIGIQDILYSRGKDPLEFKYDTITPAPPILSFMTQQDINILYDTAKSLKYAGNIQKKYDIIDRVMTNRGFIKFNSGTNRIVYRPLESYDFIVKIALDRVGLTDSPREFMNQRLLQPFVTKVFECTPCGTIATFERVKPIIRKEEFISIAADVFDLINKKIIGKYILDDIGADYFMNWGVRRSFGPVLLDFPYIYELDGDKLMCTKTIPELNNERCTGLIDYDSGFNHLVCNQCGKQYNALDLEKKDSGIEIIKGGSVDMKVILRRGDKIMTKKTGVDHIQRKPKKDTKTTNSMDVLFKGSKRDLEGRHDSDDSIKGIETHEDLMKARKELMEKQRITREQSIKESITDKQVKEHTIDKEEILEDNDNTDVTGETYDTQTIAEQMGVSYDDIPNIVEDEEAASKDLTNIDRIEDKYAHLEDDFEDESFEKIIKNTKKFY